MCTVKWHIVEERDEIPLIIINDATLQDDKKEVRS